MIKTLMKNDTDSDNDHDVELGSVTVDRRLQTYRFDILAQHLMLILLHLSLLYCINNSDDNDGHDDDDSDDDYSDDDDDGHDDDDSDDGHDDGHDDVHDDDDIIT